MKHFALSYAAAIATKRETVAVEISLFYFALGERDLPRYLLEASRAPHDNMQNIFRSLDRYSRKEREKSEALKSATLKVLEDRRTKSVS